MMAQTLQRRVWRGALRALSTDAKAPKRSAGYQRFIEKFSDPSTGALAHAFRIVRLEEDVKAYAQEHSMSYEDVIKHVPYWRQRITQRYRERQFAPLVEQYVASRNKHPDAKSLGYLVALRTCGYDLEEALATMTDEEIRNVVVEKMSKIRALVDYGPQKQIENAIKEGRWVGGGAFTTTPLQVSKSGRLSVCWGTGEEDEHSQAYSGVISVGTGHKDKVVQLRPYRSPNDQLFLAFFDTTTLDYLRNPRSRSVLLKHPSNVTYIVPRDDNGRRSASQEYKQAATQAFERYLQASSESGSQKERSN